MAGLSVEQQEALARLRAELEQDDVIHVDAFAVLGAPEATLLDDTGDARGDRPVPADRGRAVPGVGPVARDQPDLCGREDTASARRFAYPEVLYRYNPIDIGFP